MKIGTFMFGGGYAMLPLLEHEIVEKKKWLTNEEILDLYALAQCTPGVIAVNTATKTGYKIKGVLGALFATVGVVFIPFIIVIIISSVLKNFSEIEQVKNVLMGIRIAACAMMVNTIVKMLKAGIRNTFGGVIFAFAFIAAFLGVSPVVLIICAISVGLLFCREEEKP